MHPLAFPWLSFHQVCVSDPCTRKSRRLFGLETSQLSGWLLSYLLTWCLSLCFQKHVWWGCKAWRSLEHAHDLGIMTPYTFWNFNRHGQGTIWVLRSPLHSSKMADLSKAQWHWRRHSKVQIKQLIVHGNMLSGRSRVGWDIINSNAHTTHAQTC